MEGVVSRLKLKFRGVVLWISFLIGIVTRGYSFCFLIFFGIISGNIIGSRCLKKTW